VCGANPLALRTTAKQGLGIAGAGHANACVQARRCAFVTGSSATVSEFCALQLWRRVVPFFHGSSCDGRYLRGGRILLQRQRACKHLRAPRGCPFLLMAAPVPGKAVAGASSRACPLVYGGGAACSRRQVSGVIRRCTDLRVGRGQNRLVDLRRLTVTTTQS
jgi:hypothetical protein